MNRTILAALAGAVLSAGAAQIASAADIPAPVYKAAPAVIVASNWTGFYVGVHGGWAQDSTSGTFDPNIAFGWDTGRHSYGLVGGHAGFNYQMGAIVIGLEGTYSAALGSGFGSTVGTGTAAGCGIAPGGNCEARMADVWTVGARLGYAADAWLFYATGGFARARIESQFNTAGVISDGTAANHNGWFAGAGIEYMMWRNFVLGVEYRHYEFNSVNHVSPVNVAANSRTLSATADAVIARASFKFP